MESSSQQSIEEQHYLAKITASPGQAACLPACCTLEVRATWAIDAGNIAACMRQKITQMSTALTATTWPTTSDLM